MTRQFCCAAVWYKAAPYDTHTVLSWGSRAVLWQHDSPVMPTRQDNADSTVVKTRKWLSTLCSSQDVIVFDIKKNPSGLTANHFQSLEPTCEPC